MASSSNIRKTEGQLLSLEVHDFGNLDAAFKRPVEGVRALSPHMYTASLFPHRQSVGALAAKIDCRLSTIYDPMPRQAGSCPLVPRSMTYSGVLPAMSTRS